jgi:phosphatidylserine/phosphatidylglycerophosphate/cardiolipin synthase-like enzyme
LPHPRPSVPNVEYLTGDKLYQRVLAEVIPSAKDSLLIATATLKATRTRTPDGSAESVVRLLDRMAARGVEVRILHSGVPSGPFLEDLKTVTPGAFQMRRCPRTHFKAAIVDGQRLYLGSANLTGAGLGAKSAGRRNFEVGLVSDDPALVDTVADLFEAIWSGAMCRACGRRPFCPVPLESPWDAG